MNKHKLSLSGNLINQNNLKERFHALINDDIDNTMDLHFVS